MKQTTARKNVESRKGARAEAPVHSVERARHEIQTRIRDGRFAPGQRLIASDLVEELKLGPSIIRDALRLLAGEGVLELIPNRGARVPRLDRDDLINMLEAMEGIAVVGIRRAASVMKVPGNAAKIRAALRDITNAARNSTALDLLSCLPHYNMIVNDVSGNTYLNFLLERFHFDYVHRELVNASIAQHMTPNVWRQYVAQYTEMTDALIEGDGRKAEAAFRSHIKSMMTTLQP